MLYSPLPREGSQPSPFLPLAHDPRPCSPAAFALSSGRGCIPEERRYRRALSDILHAHKKIVIATAQLDDEGLANLTQRISGWITSANGAVSETNVWGRRSMLFPIKKQTEGIYLQVNFQLTPSASRELERSLRLDEKIIRHLVIRLDEE